MPQVAADKADARWEMLGCYGCKILASLEHHPSFDKVHRVCLFICNIMICFLTLYLFQTRDLQTCNGEPRKLVTGILLHQDCDRADEQRQLPRFMVVCAMAEPTIDILTLRNRTRGRNARYWERSGHFKQSRRYLING